VFAGDEELAGMLTTADFDDITSIRMTFGDGGITGYRAPYNPSVFLSASLEYVYADKLQLGMKLNYMGEQYTEYLNFENETSEGAIGRLDAYTTLDLNAGYTFTIHRARRPVMPAGLELYFTVKNLAGDVYRASRLHRLSSGIMPGGFRHFQGGLKVTI